MLSFGTSCTSPSGPDQVQGSHMQFTFGAVTKVISRSSGTIPKRAQKWRATITEHSAHRHSIYCEEVEGIIEIDDLFCYGRGALHDALRSRIFVLSLAL